MNDRQTRSVTAALAEGEHILWSARPRCADEIRLDASIWALPIAWSAFSLSVTVGASFAAAHGKGAGSIWTMAPFLLIGAVLLARPWFAWWRAQHAVYVLTDRRLFRFDRGSAPSHSMAIADLGPVESEEGADGYGALHIRLRAAATGKGRSIVYWRLRGLPDVVAVRRLIAVYIAPRDA